MVRLLRPQDQLIVPLSLSLWNYFNDPVFDGVGLAGFKSRANAFMLTLLLFIFVSYYFIFLLHFLGWFVGLGSSD